MTRAPVPLRLGAAGAAALALSACVTLLPKSEPAQLYRFGVEPATVEPMVRSQDTVALFHANSQFPQEAAGDRILTLTGGKAAYIADTRWVAPAAVLWRQAVAAAFEADPGPTRLISRGETAKADYVLRLDVRSFETRYEGGPKAAPTIVVRVRGVLTRGTEPGLVSERIFEQRVPAASNRVGAIVPSYDKAVAAVLGEVVAWANEQAKGT